MKILELELDTKTVLIIVVGVMLIISGVMLHSNSISSGVAPISFPCSVCH